MGTDADQLQSLGVGLSVNQDQIGPDVAVPMVIPFSYQGVVAASIRQWFVIGKCGNHGDEFAGQDITIPALGFTFEVPFELGEVFNRPPSTRRR